MSECQAPDNLEGVSVGLALVLVMGAWPKCTPCDLACTR